MKNNTRLSTIVRKQLKYESKPAPYPAPARNSAPSFCHLPLRYLSTPPIQLRVPSQPHQRLRSVSPSPLGLARPKLCMRPINQLIQDNPHPTTISNNRAYVAAAPSSGFPGCELTLMIPCKAEPRPNQEAWKMLPIFEAPYLRSEADWSTW